jgi:PilZ domain
MGDKPENCGDCRARFRSVSQRRDDIASATAHRSGFAGVIAFESWGGGECHVKPAARNRRYPRIGLPKGMQIAWQGRGLRTVARVATLGLGGLFIDAENPPLVGEVIRVFFEVPGGEVRATAVVRDSRPGKGMGIEFATMEQEPRARLQKLLRRLQGDSGG